MVAHTRRASWISLALLALATPVMMGTTDLTSGFEARVLAAHNRERATLGVAPLQWNENLEASAKAWADHLAATGGFEHAPEAKVDPEGENLWAGSKGYYSTERMVDGWIREKRFYKSGLFPNNSTTGHVSDVGHYTQLIWRDTTQVGCAVATGSREDVLVCRYSQAGNYVGERPI
jgi:uncharacterized protein YkwD